MARSKAGKKEEVKMKRELLIGCGNLREKRIFQKGGEKVWNHLVTLDIDSTCRPDVVWDLENLPLPFEDNSFTEIHAYDVLEHCGVQGDYQFFFSQFSDFWRILAPGGLLCGSCPLYGTPWVWGDPGHTRYIGPECMPFLSQSEYKKQIGITKMTDYRSIYRADFELEATDSKDESFYFILRAVKPSRIE